MASPAIAVGLNVGTQPPLALHNWSIRLARALRLHSVWTVDHFLGFFPQSIWDRDFSWIARPGTTPDRYYDYQVLLGHMARRAGRVRVAVGVTEPIRRHPILIAQAFLTLSHLTRRAPILGIGSGERENVEPYGLDFSTPVGRLEEALQIISTAFEARGPFSFSGRHFRLDRALLDLEPGRGRRPEIWVAAHGPRMLGLTGRFGDGWYPTLPMSPQQYGERLGAVQAAARQAGRDPAAITASLQLFLVVAPTSEAARAMLDRRAIKFMALLAPDELWQAGGLTHPLGKGFGGMVDFVPQSYDRATMDAAIAQVPFELLAEQMIWGTPQQVLSQVRALGEAGLQHVVLTPASALVSPRAAAYTLRSTLTIARRLQSGT